MKKLVIATLALGGLVSTFATAPAHATVNDPGPGLLCGFSSLTDPTTEGGAQTTEIDAGPLVITNDDNTPGTGTLICTVQVNEGDHTATDGVSASTSGTGVLYLPPTVVSYNAQIGDDVYLCTTYVDADGTTLYWDSVPPPGQGSWSTSPTAACALATSADTSPLDPVFDLLNSVFDTVFGILDPIEIQYVDPILCTVLTIAFPPEGDVPGVWDCPPYGNNG